MMVTITANNTAVPAYAVHWMPNSSINLLRLVGLSKFYDQNYKLHKLAL